MAKEYPDINDTMREEGPEAVRERSDNAKKFTNGKDHGEIGAPEFTESALALQFVERHEQELRYVSKWGPMDAMGRFALGVRGNAPGL